MSVFSQPPRRQIHGQALLDLSHPLFRADKSWIVVTPWDVYTNSAPLGTQPVDTQPDYTISVSGWGRGTLSSRSQANRLAPMFANMPKTVLMGVGTNDMRCSVGTTTAFWGMASGDNPSTTAALSLGSGGSGVGNRRTATQTTAGNLAHAVFQIGTFTGTDWTLWRNGRTEPVTYSGTGAAYSAGSSYLETGWGTYGAYNSQYTPLFIVSEAEIPPRVAQMLSINPWDVFQPARRSHGMMAQAAGAAVPYWAFARSRSRVIGSGVH